MSDGGLYDTLAAKVGPTEDKLMRLPPEMYSETGTVSGWNTPTAKNDKLGSSKIGRASCRERV